MLNNIKIRRYLIDIGFVQDVNTKKEYGNIYLYIIPDKNTKFVIDISDKVCNAYYPDFKYNKTNPYSTKETLVTLDWKDKEDEDVIIEMLKEFFMKILQIVERN